MPIQGICQGGQPIISYNFGARNNERVKEAFFTQFKVCVLFSTVCWGILMIAPQIFAMGFQLCCQQSFMALRQAKVSDILAATVTTSVFLGKFNGILKRGADR